MSETHEQKRKFPHGLTFAGRYRIVDRSVIRGIWHGTDAQAPLRDVWITFGRGSRWLSNEQRKLMEADIPGAPRLLFAGPPDGYRFPKPPDTPDWQFANVQHPIDGVRLPATTVLSASEAVSVGVSLCQMLIAWDRVGKVHCGLHPETIFVTGTDGARRFAGAMPNRFLLCSKTFTFIGEHSYLPPLDEFDGLHLPIEHAVVTVALILWYATTHEFAFDVNPAFDYPDWELWDARRKTYPGAPELGRLLHAAMHSDVSKRMKAGELLVELQQLAATWGIEIPPFPPPGLDSI